MLTLVGLTLLMGAPAVALAQEREREVEEAMRRVEEVQFELQLVLERLRETEIEAASRAMREAMDALWLAQRQLRPEQLAVEIVEGVRVLPGGDVRVVVSLDRPKMGVLLGSDEWNPETDPIGAVIQAITPGGPAEEAGIKSGDIITMADGQPLARTRRSDDSPGDKLVSIIREHEEGDTMRVEYRRGDETHTADVVLRKMEPRAYAFGLGGDSLRRGIQIYTRPEIDIAVPQFEFATPLEWPVVESFLPFRWLDVELVTLDEELGEYFGTSEGLLVVKAPRDETLGLRSGDVILNIDGREPTNARHALRIMRSYEPGESINIEIMRDQRRQTVTVTVPERDDGFFWREDFLQRRDRW